MTVEGGPTDGFPRVKQKDRSSSEAEAVFSVIYPFDLRPRAYPSPKLVKTRLITEINSITVIRHPLLSMDRRGNSPSVNDTKGKTAFCIPHSVTPIVL